MLSASLQWQGSAASQRSGGLLVLERLHGTLVLPGLERSDEHEAQVTGRNTFYTRRLERSHMVPYYAGSGVPCALAAWDSTSEPCRFPVHAVWLVVARCQASLQEQSTGRDTGITPPHLSCNGARGVWSRSSDKWLRCSLTYWILSS